MKNTNAKAPKACAACRLAIPALDGTVSWQCSHCDGWLCSLACIEKHSAWMPRLLGAVRLSMILSANVRGEHGFCLFCDDGCRNCPLADTTFTAESVLRALERQWLA